MCLSELLAFIKACDANVACFLATGHLFGLSAPVTWTMIDVSRLQPRAGGGGGVDTVTWITAVMHRLYVNND